MLLTVVLLYWMGSPPVPVKVEVPTCFEAQLAAMSDPKFSARLPDAVACQTDAGPTETRYDLRYRVQWEKANKKPW